jgi:phosphatidylglycerophosphatase C
MNLALFDFDGTITQREMFRDFMACAVDPQRKAIGMVVLAPLIVGYKLGLVSGTRVRTRVVRFAFRDAPLARIEQVALDFASHVLPATLRPEAMERIAWHKAQGDRVVVVSGAFEVYLKHWCREHELDLLCSRLQSREGILTGRYHGAQCVGPEKVRRVRQAYDTDAFEKVYAYGDTREDLDMLGIADRKFFRWQEMA